MLILNGIYVNEFIVDNPKANIIITHGIAEHQGRYKHVVKHLNEAGFNVFTYDLRGHGKSLGKRGTIKTYETFSKDLHMIVNHVKENYKGKVYLIGHSMGGGVVHIYQLKYKDVDGIISSAAATNTPKSAKALKYTGFWYLRWLKIKTKMLAKHLSRDPSVKVDNLNDPLNLKFMKVALIGEMFIKGTKYLQQNLKEFDIPILYLHGTSDEIVDVSITENTYKNNPTKDKTLITYDGAKHEIFNETNKEEVLNDVTKWLDSHI